MKILIGCEFSQIVTNAFRKLGHEAYSCDLLPCEGGHPEWHIQGDVLEVAKSQQWDMGIFFPPCTHLAVSGAPSFAEKIKDGRQQQAIEFFMEIVNLDIERIAIENPVGIMSNRYKKPDQIIQPYWFGDPIPKKTCLWLKNLPLLTKTNVVEYEYILYKSKKSKSGYSKYPITWKQNCGKKRSVFFDGIAQAMASQWQDLAPIQEQLTMFK